jgi:hypothetical protein
VGPPSSLGIIGQLIGQVGQVVESFANAIQTAYKVGASITDDHEFRETRRALKQIEAANNVIIVLNAPLIWAIDHYHIGAKDEWNAIREGIIKVVITTQDTEHLLDELAPKLPPKLSNQISNLSFLYRGRVGVLNDIDRLPAPSTPHDVYLLKALGHRWQILHEQLVRLNIALDEAPLTPPRQSN